MDYMKNSDLDIAVMVERDRGEDNEYAVFVDEKPEWVKQLEQLLPHKAHLEWLEKNSTGKVATAVRTSGRLVYKRQP
jgi:hypothetical protein